MTDKKSYLCKSATSAIFNDKRSGPNFGMEELTVVETFDGAYKCQSQVDEVVYGIPSDKNGINKLTHSTDGGFSIT